MKLKIKTTSLIILTLLALLGPSCSRKVVNLYSFREPAASGSTDSCSSIFNGLLREMRPENELKEQLQVLKSKLGRNEGLEDFQKISDDVVADAASYEDEAFSEVAVRFHSLYTEFSESRASNAGLPEGFLERYEGTVATYLQKRRELRPGKSAFRNQEHFEMLRFMEDFPNKKLSDVEVDRRFDELMRFIAFKKFTQTTTETDREEFQAFVWWVSKNKNLLERDPESTSFDSFFRQNFPQFQESYKKMRKKDKSTLREAGKEAILERHNVLSLKEFPSDYSSDDFKADALLYIRAFADLEPNFEEERFLAWLFKEGELSPTKLRELKSLAEKEGFELQLGDVLRQSYRKFAAFQDNPPFSDKNLLGQAKEKAKGIFDGLKKEAKECENLDCVSKKSLEGWGELFKLRYYKSSFSCLAHNPLVLKTMVMDMALVWGALLWHYKANEEAYQRFPFEIMVSGAVFAPIMAEANCRATFKGSLPFGTSLPKDEVFASIIKKTGRTFKAWRGVAMRGFLASAGMLGMTIGFDHLFLAMGHSIAKPLALNDLVIMMPLTFLYHGAWYGVKNLAIINPMRHKILPRLAEILTRKKGKNLNFWMVQTGLDAAMFYALISYNEWEYVEFYHEKLLPMLTGVFSAGVSLEHKREISPDGRTLDTFEGVTEDGVASHTVIEEDEGEIKLDSVDVEVPDNELERWADEILKGLEN